MPASMALLDRHVPNEIANALGERDDVERLALEVVAPGREGFAADLVLDRGAAGEKRCCRDRFVGVGTDRPCDIETGHPGQAKVEDDGRWPRTGNRPDRLFAAGRLEDPDMVAFEDPTHELPRRRDIVDNEDERRRCDHRGDRASRLTSAGPPEADEG